MTFSSSSYFQASSKITTPNILSFSKNRSSKPVDNSNYLNKLRNASAMLLNGDLFVLSMKKHANLYFLFKIRMPTPNAINIRDVSAISTIYLPLNSASPPCAKITANGVIPITVDNVYLANEILLKKPSI